MATHSSILAWEIPWTGKPEKPSVKLPKPLFLIKKSPQVNLTFVFSVQFSSVQLLSRVVL